MGAFTLAAVGCANLSEVTSTLSKSSTTGVSASTRGAASASFLALWSPSPLARPTAPELELLPNLGRAEVILAVREEALVEEEEDLDG